MSTMINDPQAEKTIGDPSKLLRKAGKLAITIRPMILSDLIEIARIEKAMYSAVKHWRYDDLFWGLSEPFIKSFVACPNWDKNEILGYAICKINHDRSTAEVMNITVLNKMQRNGIGTNLIAGIAALPYVKKLLFSVSEYSTKTQLFCKSCGFDCVKVDKGAYSYETRDGETKVFDAYRFEMEV